MPSEIDLNRAHPGRVYDYFLGGKDNYAADREAAAALEKALPDIPRMARANRDFLGRAVQRLVGVHGIRQLVDIGSGIPTSPNAHEIAQEIDPAARVVYVDNDPLVGAHSRALLTSSARGAVEFVPADATDPATVLGDARLRAVVNLAEPVGLLLVSVLMYFADEVLGEVVDTLVRSLAPGSFVVISHPTADFAPEVVARAAAVGRASGLTYIPRTRAEVEGLFSGLELCSPGVVAMPTWHPRACAVGPGAESFAASTHYWAGMARKRGSDGGAAAGAVRDRRPTSAR
jgi:SAM-dependent methyltransferase